MSAVEGTTCGLNHLEKLQVGTQNQKKRVEISYAMTTTCHEVHSYFFVQIKVVTNVPYTG
jgi:hypothetical protein